MLVEVIDLKYAALGKNKASWHCCSTAAVPISLPINPRNASPLPGKLLHARGPLTMLWQDIYLAEMRRDTNQAPSGAHALPAPHMHACD